LELFNSDRAASRRAAPTRSPRERGSEKRENVCRDPGKGARAGTVNGTEQPAASQMLDFSSWGSVNSQGARHGSMIELILTESEEVTGLTSVLTAVVSVL